MVCRPASSIWGSASSGKDEDAFRVTFSGIKPRADRVGESIFGSHEDDPLGVQGGVAGVGHREPARHPSSEVDCDAGLALVGVAFQQRDFPERDTSWPQPFDSLGLHIGKTQPWLRRVGRWVLARRVGLTENRQVGERRRKASIPDTTVEVVNVGTRNVGNRGREVEHLDVELCDCEWWEDVLERAAPARLIRVVDDAHRNRPANRAKCTGELLDHRVRRVGAFAAARADHGDPRLRARPHARLAVDRVEG
jgi:hypothetical protein